MLIIGQQSAYTGSLMKIESVLWSMQNWRSGAVREGKIPNGTQSTVKPPCHGAGCFFGKKTKTCRNIRVTYTA